MGWTRTIGLALLSTMMSSVMGVGGLVAPASAQNTPDPAVKTLIETRLAEFDALTKQVDAAGTDKAKLAELAKPMAAAVDKAHADYQELDDDWNADQKKLVIEFGQDTGNDIMQRFGEAAKKVDSVVASSGGTGCTECDPLVIVPGCQIRCCKGDRAPEGSTFGAKAWECPPIEQKTCSELRPGCPQ
jgi:hypothetical protein